MTKSVFSGLIDEEPKNLEPKEPDFVRNGPRPLIPPVHRKSDPSAILLEWAIKHWGKSVLTLRDIQAFGPHSVRENALQLAETLTQFGWFEPHPAWRRDQKKWRVIRQVVDLPTQ